MKIIGLTGPSGAGKSFSYPVFEKYNIHCIDTDDVYHKLLIPPSACVDELVDCFGSSVLAPDGTLDRKELAKIVFSDKSRDKIRVLEKITHKYITEETHKIIDDCRTQKKLAVVIDAPVLFESELANECDFTIAVLCDQNTRVERIMARDTLTKEQAVMRVNAQQCDEYFTTRADYTVVNDSPLKSAKEQIIEILKTEKII